MSDSAICMEPQASFIKGIFEIITHKCPLYRAYIDANVQMESYPKPTGAMRSLGPA